MEWVKTTAKTLPEAIDLALDNLGVDESEAEIVVLEEPRQGLFGRMRGTARVEARVKPKAIRPKTERNRNRKGRGEGGRNKGGGQGRNRNRSNNRSGNRSGNDKGGRNDDARRQDRGEKGRDDKNENQGAKAGNRGGGGRGPNSGGENTDGGNKSGNQSKGRRSRGRGNRDGENADRENRNQGGSDRGNKRSTTAKNEEAKPKEEAPVEDVAEHLESFLRGLTDAFGFESDVSVDSSEQDVLVGRIEGQYGLLVGPKGRTLDAIQELARISCQRTVPSSIRIKVDVGGYRQQRIEALTAFAQKAADSAVEGGNEVALEPMSPADRKAIHDALSEDGRVETRSVGTEPRRKVLVVPLETADDEPETEELNGHAEESIDEQGDGSADNGGQAEGAEAEDAETEEMASAVEGEE